MHRQLLQAVRAHVLRPNLAEGPHVRKGLVGMASLQVQVDRARRIQLVVDRLHHLVSALEEIRAELLVVGGDRKVEVVTRAVCFHRLGLHVAGGCCGLLQGVLRDADDVLLVAADRAHDVLELDLELSSGDLHIFALQRLFDVHQVLIGFSANNNFSFNILVELRVLDRELRAEGEGIDDDTPGSAQLVDVLEHAFDDLVSDGRICIQNIRGRREVVAGPTLSLEDLQQLFLPEGQDRVVERMLVEFVVGLVSVHGFLDKLGFLCFLKPLLRIFVHSLNLQPGPVEHQGQISPRQTSGHLDVAGDVGPSCLICAEICQQELAERRQALDVCVLPREGDLVRAKADQAILQARLLFQRLGHVEQLDDLHQHVEHIRHDHGASAPFFIFGSLGLLHLPLREQHEFVPLAGAHACRIVDDHRPLLFVLSIFVRILGRLAVVDHCDPAAGLGLAPAVGPAFPPVAPVLRDLIRGHRLVVLDPEEAIDTRISAPQTVGRRLASLHGDHPPRLTIPIEEQIILLPDRDLLVILLRLGRHPDLSHVGGLDLVVVLQVLANVGEAPATFHFDHLRLRIAQRRGLRTNLERVGNQGRRMMRQFTAGLQRLPGEGGPPVEAIREIFTVLLDGLERQTPVDNHRVLEGNAFFVHLHLALKL
mmetsp:Transcript_102046/g.327447  ORF Transcript_102046/g.327447 Transcript_102046/m.327447 type:complete len:650 (-) Transcript_102046:392-2341(-)